MSPYTSDETRPLACRKVGREAEPKFAGGRHGFPERANGRNHGGADMSMDENDQHTYRLYPWADVVRAGYPSFAIARSTNPRLEPLRKNRLEGAAPSRPHGARRGWESPPPPPRGAPPPIPQAAGRDSREVYTGDSGRQGSYPATPSL